VSGARTPACSAGTPVSVPGLAGGRAVMSACATMLLLSLLLPVLPAAAPALQPDEAGVRQILQANRGLIVLFDFWATWCDPCRAELPALVKLEEKYRSRGVVLVTISCDSPDSGRAAAGFLRKTGVRPPFYIKRVQNDEDFINSVDVKWSGALPALFLYDRAGTRAGSFFGETDSVEIERAISKLFP